jgi:hypothetical protein
MRPAPERPAEQALGIGMMLLRVAADVHVEEDAGAAVGGAPVCGIGEAEVRLADAGGPVDHGERAGEKAASQHGVEPRKSRRDARCHRDGL